MSASRRFAVLVVHRNGEIAYAREAHSGDVIVYPSKRRAEREAAFLRVGIGDEVQSVNVVVCEPRRISHD